ncbi:M23 family metallopeptidase [Aquimarina gracilis]|uniref:M23 family metallopeptidase n=1 Tax=Aquimarina gracilis TaxID=874422 RepID=A0ABU5ZXE7_9FLAO|nr:M23 family metallopeptidase [Aquimarina gracilis]MEB3346535.1 M23 family metallopeptidase [Aquimarina gracilis]
MFFIKRRHVSFIISFLSWFLFCIQGAFGQQNDSGTVVYYENLYIEGKTFYLPVFQEKNQNSKEGGSISDKHFVDFSSNWNNKTFNPYRGENISFPFQLNFDTQKFASPISRKMVVTSRYGWRRGRPHRGIDIDLRTGDSVRSILDGKVRYARYHGGHGKTVIVRHNNGLETVYAHLSKFLVKENDEVKKGQVIAKGGITGNARGSHLHLEVRYHGKSINPEYLFEFTDETEIRSNVVFVTRKWTTPHYHRSTRKSNIIVHTSEEDIALLQEQQKKVYTVKQGDTLYRIANTHGLPISEICKINSIRKNSVLRVGQQIIISAAQ